MEYYDPRDYDLAGRIAKLKTLHGTLETPYLFPVIDPIRQSPDLETIKNIGFTAFITNAYLLYKRNRGMIRDIHDYFSWKNTIMTDSGGYQILLYGNIEIDNKTIVEYQKNIGVDIGVILDIPTGSKDTWNEAFSSINETYRRAWEALPSIMDSRQLWVYPIQGAPYLDLLVYSAKKSWRLPYHIYALGSPTLYLEKYDYDRILEFTIITRTNIPPYKPLHVFGVGHPMIIPFLVAVGADLFDSASYILYARDERLMFDWGTRSLRELTYLPCECPICSKYSVEELFELDKSKRIKLIAIHNLYVLMRELKRVKQAIREGRLWEYISHRSRVHPSLRKAFKTLLKYRVFLEKYNPETKTPTHALLLIDQDSILNPRLKKIREKTTKLILSSKDQKILLIPAIEKPFNQNKIYIEIIEKYRDYKIYFYHPYLGLFPPELSNTYPYFQHEIGEYTVNEEIIKEIIETLGKKKPSILLVVSTHIPGYQNIVREIIRRLSDKINVKILDMH
ncbi:MAG: tRNA guanosine(15) transglycosylase TgtA [Desulfurococcales archaeon ex4484_58]|nr:MAG: tRNA guanosine(15) transglycosylase TgtA [Desulfurococcales archaeon ex4484_58]